MTVQFQRFPTIDPQQPPNYLDHSKPWGITLVEVEKVACYTLGVLGLITALSSEELTLRSISILAASGSLVWLGQKLNNYENESELTSMRQTAEEQSFSEIVNEHGLEALIQYRIVPPELLQQKFYFQYWTTPLSEILQKYSFSDIRRYQLATPSILRTLLLTELRYMPFGDLNMEFLIQCRQGKILTGKEVRLFQKLRNKADSLLATKNMEIQTIDQKYPERFSNRLSNLATDQTDSIDGETSRKMQNKRHQEIQKARQSISQERPCSEDEKKYLKDENNYFVEVSKANRIYNEEMETLQKEFLALVMDCWKSKSKSQLCLAFL